MKIIKKYKKHLLILLAIIIIISLTILKLKLNNKEDTIIEENITLEENIETIPIEEEKEIIKKVSVDIKGAVVKPGVYEIEEDKRVIDVINLAGGLREDANTLLINLAKTVTDEMVVIIYTETQIKEASTKKINNIITPIDTVCNCPEITNDACLNSQSSQTEASSNSNKTSVETNSKVNINTATLEQLQTLSGIGESKARAIIEYRESNGNFTNIEDIKKVSGIGDSVYEKIKDNITV